MINILIIDFQYKAVINIWSSLGVRNKPNFVGYYKEFLKKLIEIKEEHYKAQKSLYNGIQETERFFVEMYVLVKKVT